MALDGTATGLRASIAEWLDDATLAAAIPDFIVMAEGRINRRLLDLDMEARATTTLDGEFVTLPPDFGGMRSIYLQGYPEVPLDAMDSGELRRRFAGYTVGRPAAFCIAAGQLQFGPKPNGSYVLEMTYYRQLAPLATNETNWMLTAHPDVYLYACLLAGEMRGWNDSRLPLLKGAFDEGLAEIAIKSERRRYGAAPIAPRINRA